MQSDDEHHLCQPVFYHKSAQGPASEISPPFHLAWFGNIANVYAEQHRDRVLEIVQKGGRKATYSSYAEVVTAYEDFCRFYHPDEAHTCLSSHYRVPLHRILDHFRAVNADDLDPFTMMVFPSPKAQDEATDDSASEEEAAMQIDANNAPNSPTTLTPVGVHGIADATSIYDVAQPSFLDEWEGPRFHARCLHFRARGVPQPYYLFRTDAGWSFIFACRIDALALFHRFLARGVYGDFRQYTMAQLHALHENNGPHVLNYGVHGWGRFGVLNDRDAALRLLQGECEDWHSSSLMIASDYIKCRQWAYQVHADLSSTTHERFEVGPDDDIF
ncbi:hypothetical protein ONZ45_g14394 [Pleurotus djamor]|nr:hypothetical protein ONZ45_g14394 [Pleurotus djamor]